MSYSALSSLSRALESSSSAMHKYAQRVRLYFCLLPSYLTLRNDLRADAVCGKELQEERVWDTAVDQVHFSDAFVERFDG